MSVQTALAVDPPSDVEMLAKRLGADWPALDAARRRSAEQMNQLEAATASVLRPHADLSMVVFGSLARGEFTSGSDADWTLLVDGPADAAHRDLVERVRTRCRELALPPPARGGAFGRMTVSHDLIHQIGGDDDTNRNTTQRLLLLLESAPVGRREAYDRVLENVLRRYVEEDLTSASDSAYRVPRFLQNDFARYWRTIAVDFAHKRRERGPQKWALRSAKLRMSRKLLYVAGLLACFSVDFRLRGRGRPHPYATPDVVDHLSALLRKTPLDIVAGVVLEYFGELSVSGARLFGAYDRFLAILDDKASRDRLAGLVPADADRDPLYEEVRNLGAQYQEALDAMFFDSDTPLPGLIRKYGVF